MKNKREDRFEAIVDQFVKNDLIAQEEYSYYLYGVKHLEVLIMTTGGVLLSGILLKEILFTVVFLITFSLLRIGWQGIHAKTKIRCFCYSLLLDTIRVKEGMEKPIAENLLNNEQVKESVLLLNEFHKNGLLKEGSANTLANGNFFVMLMYADDPELLQEYFDTICEENNKKPLSLKYVKIGEHYPPHRTGGMNSVLKGGNTEKAIDLLKRTVTDEEISNLLKYGTEEMEETPAMLQWMFGNDQWSKEKNAVKESLIAGFQFDGRVYKEQIDQLSQIYYSYSELFRGLSENPQEDYEKMMQEMEAAGINAITEEVNNQLDQWYNTVR